MVERPSQEVGKLLDNRIGPQVTVVIVERPEVVDIDVAEGKRLSFLVKIVTSMRGFPVRLFYATKANRIGNLGSVKAHLPKPEILVTHTRWDVYLPDKVAQRVKGKKRRPDPSSPPA